ncbi:MAG TPA: hemerythrin domain-containing protein [Pseudonocardiaceae bacterium]|nr:hemerythrin domain-containing protein [Pseudonocardiaceae bacterium]
MSDTSESIDRVRAIGGELVRVHQRLRDDLARLHDRLDTGEDLMPLQAHCFAFCAAVTRHHTSEDATAFPLLGAQLPALAPVLDQLSQDHRLVEDIVLRLRELLTAPGDADDVRREIDGLSAILESHFRWEEKALVDALNAIDSAPSAEALFGRVS